MIKCTHLRAVGKQRAWAPPGGAGGNGRSRLPSSCCVLLCPGTLLPGSGTEGPVCIDRQGEKGSPQSQHSGILSRCGDELERLMGADDKEACSLKTWSCFLNWGDGRGGQGEVYEGPEQEGELCRQQHGSLIRTDLKS